MPHWRTTSEPDASAWQAILDFAQRGLIHGMQAHNLLRKHRPYASPADTASLLRDMVEAGVLRPAKKDLAGAGLSVRAFRGLQYTSETPAEPYPDPQTWLNSVPSEAADAHLWTFEPVR